MLSAPPPYYFQAAVEQTLSLVFQDQDGRWEGHDYCVTVITERPSLNEHDVVMDFRALDAALDSVLEPLRGHSLSELGMGGPIDVAKKIAEAIAPTIELPVKLAAVSLQDGTGRRITLQQ
jgi:6-pyruvoyl-tetrahydropterin synthase